MRTVLRAFRRRATLAGAAALGLVLALPGAASANHPYPGGHTPPPTVGGEKFFRGGMPRTGLDILLLLLIALVLLLLGLVVRRFSRRTTSGEP